MKLLSAPARLAGLAAAFEAGVASGSGSAQDDVRNSHFPMQIVLPRFVDPDFWSVAKCRSAFRKLELE